MNTRSLPRNPSLEFDKKQAKKLLDELRGQAPGAMARLRAQHPRYRHGEPVGTLALHDAQLVVAREYGFASWPRWKDFVSSRQLTLAERADALVRAVCSADLRRARTLLAADPELQSFDIYSAVCCGDAETVRRLLERDPGLANARGGPNGWHPIVYGCFSRFLRADAERSAGIVAAVRELLARGADPNAHFYEGEGEQRWLQTCLYGAAGIANSEPLTRLLLEAGARVLAEDGEVLYHACEFRDVSCLRLVLAACPPAPAWRALMAPDAKSASADNMISYCLGRALDFDNEAAALLFLEYGANPNLSVPWHDLRSHMHKATRHGRSLATLTAMLDRGGDFNLPDGRGISPYRYAVRYAKRELAALFEARGADPVSATAEDHAIGALFSGEPSSLQLDAETGHELLNQAGSDPEILRRLLAAGADPNFPCDLPPLHGVCWTGDLEAARVLVEAGASLTAKNSYGGDALAATLHGSEHCTDPQGGSTMRLDEEICHGRYTEIVELLIRSGAPLNDHVWGSEAVQEVLRRYGVPDE